MTPSQKKAINGSATMQVLVRAMQQDGEAITFKNHYVNSVNDCIAQVRTENMVFDWIVTPRGRIVHEDYTVMGERMKNLIANAA